MKIPIVHEEDELLGQEEGQEDDGGNDDDEMCEDDNGDSLLRLTVRSNVKPKCGNNSS